MTQNIDSNLTAVNNSHSERVVILPNRASISLQFHTLIERYRFPVLLVTLVISVIAVAASLKLKGETRLDIWFIENDPDLVQYQTFVNQFGGGETLVVLLRPKQIFDEQFLSQLDNLTRSYAGESAVTEIISLTSARTIQRTHRGVEIGPLIPTVPQDDRELYLTRERVLADPLYRNLLLLEDGSQTPIIFVLRDVGEDLTQKQELLSRIKASLNEVMPSVSYSIAGTPVLDDALMRYMIRDMKLLGPLTALVIVIALAWFFRSIAGVLIPLTLVATALCWTFGLMTILGWKANILTTILAPLIGGAGIAECIHIQAHYQRCRNAGIAPVEASRQSFSRLFTPCLVTASTTVVGMFSLIVIPLGPVRQLGVLAGFGTAVAFLLTVTALPAVLTLLPAGHVARSKRTFLNTTNRSWTTIGRRNPKGVLLLGLVIGLTCGAGVMRLRMGNTITSYLRPGDPVLSDFEKVDHALGGTGTIDIILTAPPGRVFTDPAMLNSVAECRKFISTQPGFGRTWSLLEPYQALVQASGREETSLTINDERWYLLLIESDESIRQYLSVDKRTARLTAQIKISQWNQVNTHIQETERWLAVSLKDGVTGHVTGYLKLMSNMQRSLLDSQLAALAITFAVMVLLITALFHSWRIGLLSMVPNILPVIVTLGLMGWMHRPLDVGTILVGDVLLAVIVDDTIHYLFFFRRSLESEGNIEAAIEQADEVVPAIIATSIILAGTFGVAVFGSFKPSVNFGLLSIITLLTALLYEVLVLPAVIAISRPHFGRRLVKQQDHPVVPR